MSTIFPTTVPSKRLAASINAASLTLQLNNILGWDGNALTSADFGTKLYAVLRNDSNTLMEIIELDPSTIASASITILLRGLKFTGDLTTEVTANKLTWVRNETIVELGTDVPQLFKSYVDALAAQTIAGVKTFSSSPVVPTPSGNTDAANKAYVDGVVSAGASDANTTTKGLVEIQTQAEFEAGTTTGGTTAPLVHPANIGARFFSGYAADAGANDTYVITLSPVPSAYFTGMIISFKANTVNTGACTINVNSLGAKSLKVAGSDPKDGYIKASAQVLAQYDGTNFNILSVSGVIPISQDSSEIYAADAGANDTYVITLSPVPAAYVTGMVVRFKANTLNTGACTLNVNSLGAISIKKYVSSDLITGDILANQMVEVMYDGTNFQMLSMPNATTASGTINDNTTVATSTGGGTNTDTVVTHGLGVIPSEIVISCRIYAQGASADEQGIGQASFNAAGTICNSFVIKFLGTAMGASTAGAALTAAGTGNPSESVTVSVVSITATQFTFRINGVYGTSAMTTSEVTGIRWTARV